MLLKTACAPVFLPVDEFNKINFELIPSYFNYLYENGIRSIFVNGGCGEFSSLTVSDRKRILEKWFEVVSDDVQVIVNIGTNNLDDTIELGNHATSFLKLYGIAIVPPYYTAIKNEENLLDYFMTIACSLDKEIPILYYHYPSVSKVDVNIDNFLKLVKKNEFYQLSAVKCTDANFDNFLTFLNGIQQNDLSINMYCGFDTLIDKTIESGGKGAILGFVNIKPLIVNKLIQDITITDSNKKIADSIANALNETIKFSIKHRVDLTGLLKIATEYFSNLKLGPMKKPYVVPIDKVMEYQKVLSKWNFEL